MSVVKQKIHSVVYTILFLALVFCIPFYQKYLSIIIVLIGINWLAEWNFREKIARITSDVRNKNNLLFAVLYVLYLLGLLYSENYKYGSFDIEVKLSLLIFPILLSTMSGDFYRVSRINWLLWSFVTGAFVSTVVCILFASYKFIDTNSASVFYYSRLSVFLHPGYFSMYLNFAIAIILYFLSERGKQLGLTIRILCMLLITWFFVFIILLSSKAGIICLAIVFVVSIVCSIFRKKSLVQALILTVVVSLAFWMSIILLPQSFGRMTYAGNVIANSEDISSDTNEGTGERILIWKSSLEIIKKNFFFGVGTGDVKDALLDVYESNDILMAGERQLNAHNQFLQTFIALGIIGFALLLLLFIVPAFSSIQDNYYLYLVFLLIVGFNFLVESMLERQAGVIFYAFFNSYLYMIKKRL